MPSSHPHANRLLIFQRAIKLRLMLISHRAQNTPTRSIMSPRQDCPASTTACDTGGCKLRVDAFRIEMRNFASRIVAASQAATRPWGIFFCRPASASSPLGPRLSVGSAQRSAARALRRLQRVASAWPRRHTAKRPPLGLTAAIDVADRFVCLYCSVALVLTGRAASDED